MPPACAFARGCDCHEELMSNRIVITGGAGCIGSELASALLDAGDHVTVVDNLSSGRREHLDSLLAHPRFRFIEGDLLGPDVVGEAVRGSGMVYHLAANSDVKFVPGDATDKDLKQNTICTYNVLESMRAHGVRRLAFSSTSAVYGVSGIQPIPEDAPARPISLYGAAKLGCEALIGAFQNLFEMDCWIFRFANIVGPKVRRSGRTVVGDFVARLTENPSRLRILGDGRQAKSYLLASECIAAMRFAVEHAPRGLNIFNIGCSDSITVRQIARMVIEAMELEDVSLDFTGGEGGWPGDVPRFILDVSSLNRLGWRAQHTSQEAIAAAIRLTMEHMGVRVECKQ
jgi:UDP-glucose 4-epimerase